jgi:hypothetical protein
MQHHLSLWASLAAYLRSLLASASTDQGGTLDPDN